jgi:hypothetical protein
MPDTKTVKYFKNTLAYSKLPGASFAFVSKLECKTNQCTILQF